MKPLVLCLLAVILVSCGSGLSEIEIPANVSYKNKRLKIVFTDNLPPKLDCIELFENDTIIKKVDVLGEFRRGDTITLKWSLKPEKQYHLQGFGIPGNYDIYGFKNDNFMVDPKTDTLIYNFKLRIDTTHRSKTF